MVEKIKKVIWWKWAIGAGAAFFFVFTLGFQPIVTVVYLFKGESWKGAREMAQHSSFLIKGNLINLPLYLDAFQTPAAFPPHKAKKRFFGLNVAPSSSEEDDEIILKDLENLGVETLRVDYGYGPGYEESNGRIEEFLRKAASRYDILLHVVHAPEKAELLSDEEEGERWRKFINRLFSMFSQSIKRYEIGAVPNRRKWSRYTLVDYIRAQEIAAPLAKRYGVSLLGPNIQDFEPFWQLALFEELKKRGIDFAASTDNLFVDRAVEPELFDTHVLGESLAQWAAMDLTNKSKIIDIFSEKYGIEDFIVTYTQWNLEVPAPFYFSSSERRATVDRYADYLVRYHTLAAAGSYIDSVYWGEYASYKEGILDDLYNPKRHEVPLPDSHHKFLNRKGVEAYGKRPAYYAYQTMARQLSGADFLAELDLGPEAFGFLFEKNEKNISVLWTFNGKKRSYKIDREKKCRVLSRDGAPVDVTGELLLTGTPLYLICDKGGVR